MKKSLVLLILILLLQSPTVQAESTFDIETFVTQNYFKGDSGEHTSAKNYGFVRYCEKYVALGDEKGIDSTITYLYRNSGEIYSTCGFWVCRGKGGEALEACRQQCRGKPKDLVCEDFCPTWRCSIFRDDPVAARRFIVEGQDVNELIHKKRVTTPLHSASHSGYPELVRLLLEAGAEPNRINSDGYTPLFSNIRYVTSPEIIKALINAGTDLSIEYDSNGRKMTALEYLRESKREIHKEILPFLEEASRSSEKTHK